jgi:hypothetical protein
VASIICSVTTTLTLPALVAPTARSTAESSVMTYFKERNGGAVLR